MERAGSSSARTVQPRGLRRSNGTRDRESSARMFASTFAQFFQLRDKCGGPTLHVTEHA